MAYLIIAEPDASNVIDKAFREDGRTDADSVWGVGIPHGFAGKSMAVARRFAG
jgi:hypothetical protein